MTSPASPTAFITGASTGLGYAIAVGLARAGYDLAVSGREVGRLDALLRDSAVQGRKVVPLQLDLRLEADIAQAFAAAVEAFGDIDVLVNNAGRPLLKPALDVTWAEWDDVVNINLKGAYFMSRTFAAHCIARGRPGCIVSLASTHGLTGFAGRSVYGISKGGLIQMTRMLAIEWDDEGHPDRHDPVDGALPNDVPDVRDGEEDRREDAHRDADRDERDENPVRTQDATKVELHADAPSRFRQEAFAPSPRA